MRKNSLIIVFFLFLLLGCTSEMDKRVETVLSISGSNRTELEAVLDHYKHEPQKLKAAKFLIANMRYHHSFYSLRNPRQHPLLDSLTRVADSLFYHSVYVATDSFIERNSDKPFFLYVGTNDVHVPRFPHPRFVGKSGMGYRGDAILQFDYTVGKLSLIHI